MVREYEENRRVMLEQQAVLENMPAKEGFGYDSPTLPTPALASTSKSKASSPLASSAAGKGKGKRRKTPEYTDSEEESG